MCGAVLTRTNLPESFPKIKNNRPARIFSGTLVLTLQGGVRGLKVSGGPLAVPDSKGPAKGLPEPLRGC